ncbi:aminoacyl-tRNA hydrolase [Candidatus Woesebacteria bacterium]|nr:aminoacyl-tRNA hydrolase [Candidatus Woesebacteria bacterium]
MKIIVGLGNPGEKYSKNRHNVGFMVVEELARREFSIYNFQFTKKFNSEMVLTKEFMLVKPQTFMNDSGLAVSAICQFYKIKLSDLYIVHDDLDITIGNYKIQHGKGPQVHNGLRSVEEKLGSDQFWNVRVGVENREVRGNKGIPGVVYSLQDFNGEEKVTIEGVIEKVTRELGIVLQGETS